MKFLTFGNGLCLHGPPQELRQPGKENLWLRLRNFVLLASDINFLCNTWEPEENLKKRTATTEAVSALPVGEGGGGGGGGGGL